MLIFTYYAMLQCGSAQIFDLLCLCSCKRSVLKLTVFLGYIHLYQIFNVLTVLLGYKYYSSSIILLVKHFLLCLVLLATYTYYAQNYAGIVSWSLYSSCVIMLGFGKSSHI